MLDGALFCVRMSEVVSEPAGAEGADYSAASVSTMRCFIALSIAVR